MASENMVFCPHCHAGYEWNAANEGQTFTCGTCHRDFTFSRPVPKAVPVAVAMPVKKPSGLRPSIIVAIVLGAVGLLLTVVALFLLMGNRRTGTARMATLPAGTTRTVTLPGGEKMEFVWCPAGSFTMGSPSSEDGHEDDETQHRVTLTKGFWMGRTEVTKKQWESVMGHDPSEFRGGVHPVENVSWEDCQSFCRKCRAAGLDVRLPTEAEWEYACRAGSTGPFAGTGDLEDMGWYCHNSDCETHAVAKKKPNAWGLYDMHGNVWEWCEDWYGDYPTGTVTDPTGPTSGSNRVVRGGSWSDSARYCRSASRLHNSPSSGDYDLGFRLCCSAGLSK